MINILFAGVMAGFSLGQAVPNVQVRAAVSLFCNEQ